MNNENAKVTVILPVYNGEKYLSRAVTSVLDQSIGNEAIKIFIVNDGSSDNSATIVKQFQIDYPEQIKYIEQDNQGVAYSRNLGIEHCRTKWLTFIDQDDFFENDYLETLINDAESLDADVLISGYRRIDPANNILYQTKLNRGEGAKFSNVALWSKLHKASFLKSNYIRVFDNKVGEDIAFSFEELFKSEKIYCSEYIGYNWLDNSTSVSNTIQKEITEILPSIIQLFNYCTTLKSMYSKTEEYFIILRIIGYLHLTMKASNRKDFINAWQALDMVISEKFPKWYKNKLIYLGVKGTTFRLYASMLVFVLLYRFKLLKYIKKK
jgi:glycosyltransferase involved in cell wall biosynthesis